MNFGRRLNDWVSLLHKIIKITNVNPLVLGVESDGLILLLLLFPREGAAYRHLSHNLVNCQQVSLFVVHFSFFHNVTYYRLLF